MSSYKACKKCLERPTGFGVKWAKSGSDFCNVHGGQLPEVEERAKAAVEAARLALRWSVDYDRGMETLKTPRQWMLEAGIDFPNQSIWEQEGRTRETPINYETYRNITQTLCVNMVAQKIPKTIGKMQAIERIETKIEEFKEASYTMASSQWTEEEWEDHRFAQGHISGLQQALELLQDL